MVPTIDKFLLAFVHILLVVLLFLFHRTRRHFDGGRGGVPVSKEAEDYAEGLAFEVSDVPVIGEQSG